MATKTTPKKAAKKATAKPGNTTGASKQTASTTRSAGTLSKAASGKPAPSSAGARKIAARVPGGSTGVGAKSKASAKAGTAVGKAASRSATGKAAGKTSSAKDTKTVARKAGQVTRDRNETGPEGTTKANKSATPKKKTASAKPTARQALAKTRKLLKDKQQRDTRTPAWQEIDLDTGGAAQPGFQSVEARSRAQERHAEEIRLKPIQGSVSTRDRRNQGKRDKG